MRESMWLGSARIDWLVVTVAIFRDTYFPSGIYATLAE
jgi:hypothetical protein